MTTYVEYQIENIGAVERVIRGSLGMSLIVMVLLVPTLSSTLIAVFSIVALYAVFTAIMTWDPLYALARSSQQRGETVRAGEAPYPAQGQSRSIHDYKKAA